MEIESLEYYGDLLSVADLAVIFSVSKQTVYKEISSGNFGEVIRIGKSFKVPKIYIYNKFFINYK